MRRFFLYLTTLLILASCGDKSNEVVLRGSFINLRQADFYIYSTDDTRAKVDTIHVRSGRFEIILPLDDKAVYHLVYPNLQEQIIFASSGDVIEIEGNANSLKEVTVNGNDDNKAYTKLRLDINKTDKRKADQLVSKFISANPDSRVSAFLRTERNNVGTSQLQIGKKLPEFRLISNGDTITNSTFRGHRTLISFYARWSKSGNQPKRQTRHLLRKHNDLYALSYSLDVEQGAYLRELPSDSILHSKYNLRWKGYCDFKGLKSNLFEKWQLYDIPLFILTDTSGVVTQICREYEKLKL